MAKKNQERIGTAAQMDLNDFNCEGVEIYDGRRIPLRSLGNYNVVLPRAHEGRGD